MPTVGTTSWGSILQTDTFLKIAQHNHTGSGNGSQLGTGSLIADAVTGAKLRLDNDEYLRGRNNADSANINILKVNISDLIELGATVNNFNIKNNTYITGRNAANSANINMIKVNISDELALGATLANADLKANTYLTSNSVNVAKVDSNSRVDLMDGSVVVKGSATLTDNTAVATAVPNMPSASIDEGLWIFYKITRSTSVQFGQLIIDENGSGLIEEFYGDDCGVTFTEDAGVVDYVTTSTGNNATITYTIFKL